MATLKPRLEMPRDPAQRAHLVAVIKDLSSEAAEGFFGEAKIWLATAEDGRDVIGVLNQRYDLCVFECGSPAPWFAVAFDTQTRELLVAKEFPNGQPISCPECAAACAAALGESVRHRECYDEPRFRR